MQVISIPCFFYFLLTSLKEANCCLYAYSAENGRLSATKRAAVAYFAPVGRPVCSGHPAVLLRNMHLYSSLLFFLVSHSHITVTFQPEASNSEIIFLSLLAFSGANWATVPESKWARVQPAVFNRPSGRFHRIPNCNLG